MQCVERIFETVLLLNVYVFGTGTIEVSVREGFFELV